VHLNVRKGRKLYSGYTCHWEILPHHGILLSDFWPDHFSFSKHPLNWSRANGRCFIDRCKCLGLIPYLLSQDLRGLSSRKYRIKLAPKVIFTSSKFQKLPFRALPRNPALISPISLFSASFPSVFILVTS
jgi:hypothetical protein